MSATFARVILGVGLGAVAAVLYTIFSSNRRHGYHAGGGGDYRPPRNDDDWGPGPGAWKDDDDPRPSRSKKSKKQEEGQGQSAEDEMGNLKGCPICYEAWDFLKRQHVPVWTTQCGHLFCYPCLHQAIPIEGSCPSCRKHVNMRNCHRVYI